MTTMIEDTTTSAPSEPVAGPVQRPVRTALANVGAAALEAEAARKTRAKARTALRKLRLMWQDETGEWYDKDECRGVDGADEMEAAIAAREQAQKAYRAAYSRLRHVIRRYCDRPNAEVTGLGRNRSTDER